MPLRRAAAAVLVLFAAVLPAAAAVDPAVSQVVVSPAAADPASVFQISCIAAPDVTSVRARIIGSYGVVQELTLQEGAASTYSTSFVLAGEGEDVFTVDIEAARDGNIEMIRAAATFATVRRGLAAAASDNEVTVTATDLNGIEYPVNYGQFTVARSGSTTDALDVTVSVGGSATNGVDYETIASTVTIPAGASRVNLRVVPLDDETYEDPETVVLTVAAAETYTVGSPSSATVTLTSDDGVDGPTSAYVEATDAHGLENPLDQGQFTFRRTGSTASLLRVYFSVSGTATNGVDYDTISKPVIIPAGASFAHLRVVPINDSTYEVGETVVVTVLAATGYRVGSPASATVTITSEDGQNGPTSVSVTASDPGAAEFPANAGQFTLTRTGSTASPVTVYYALGGTATSGVDYSTMPRPVTIPAGSSSVPLAVNPIDDPGFEGTETVTLRVTAATGYMVGSPSIATVSITDDDPKPQVSVTAADPHGAESPRDFGLYRFDRYGDTSATLTVHYTLSGTTTNGEDYETLSGVIVIPAGRTISTLLLKPLDDLKGGPSGETVVLTLLAGTGYDISAPISATVTITNNDAPPPVTVVASDPEAAEPDDPGRFTVTVGGDPEHPAELRFDYWGTTATPQKDYLALPPTRTISAAGSFDMTVNVLDDAPWERPESVIMRIVPGEYNQGNDTATVWINSDDDPPPVWVRGIDNWAYEWAPENAGLIRLERAGACGRDLIVNLNISGTATNGVDYEEIPSEFLLPAGSCSVDIPVTPIDDCLNEVYYETVSTTVAPGAGYVVDPAQANVGIYSTEGVPVVTIHPVDDTGSEAPVDELQFRVDRSYNSPNCTPPHSLTVYISFSGSATEGSDYTADTYVVIPAGELSGFLVVTPVNDSTAEGAETVIAEIFPEGLAYSRGTPRQATGSIADDD